MAELLYDSDLHFRCKGFFISIFDGKIVLFLHANQILYSEYYKQFGEFAHLN